MACRLLVGCANDMAIPRGSPGVAQPVSALGIKEVLPKWGSIIITDASVAEIKAMHLRQQWFIEFKHTIISQDDTTYRIKTEVADEFVDVSRLAKNVMKTKMIGFLQREANATSITFANDSMTFTILKSVDIPELKSKFADVYNTVFSSRKFYFTEAQVDALIAAGGEIEMTKAQLINKVKNKLDD